MASPAFIGAISTQPAASSGDPYFANVSSLLHFDGSFVDQKGKIWTPGSGATIDTTDPIVGTGSAHFDGTTGSYVTADSGDYAFGLGAFTIEFIMVLDGAQTGKYFFDMGSGNRLVIQITPSGNLAYYDPDSGISSTLYTDGPVPDVSVARHIAIARDTGGVLRAFYNGVQWGSYASHLNAGETTVQLGRYGGGSGYEAKFWMDELRITKGVARYTANFTPPTTAFPDS